MKPHLVYSPPLRAATACSLLAAPCHLPSAPPSTQGYYGSLVMEDFLEAMIPAMPRNDKALQNWRAMHVPPGEPAAQPSGSPILLKTAYKHMQRMLRPHHHVLADAGDSWFNATKLVLPGGARYEVQVRACPGWET